ncbi:D-2-hydroxyacid dehydrogenase [Sabulicella rubraurantiaca]|uniref:D-2-hydroxyacid dehydrogenase n=1 Tax=Sabulicella rubraurantiaca TaxID=2811429 RepID=UPI001A979351|nr:D-2-hydroxyacid dehydrogenase [Sabulicella rubraurantiaca]
MLDNPTICFAHVAYQCGARWEARGAPHPFFEVRSLPELEARIGEADVLVVSGLWRNTLPALAPKLRFVQSLSAGTDQYDRDVFRQHKIRLASAAGANAAAVSEHALSLLLGITRNLFTARDDQHRTHWSGMKSDFAVREDELAGKTAIVVGMGRIGGRLIRLLKALDMTVIGIRANPSAGKEGADEVHALSALPEILPRADAVLLVCPLTAETTGLINPRTLGAMKQGAILVNCARGKVVEEEALLAALESGKLSAAGLDVTVEEPLPSGSAFWSHPRVFLTPHTAGETRKYEDNVLDLMQENLRRLRAGQDLVNAVV